MYPFNMLRVDFIHQYCVKAAGCAAVAQKVVLGSPHQFLLLVWGDAHAGPAEIGIAAQANFNKYQRITIAHDQVYFAKTAAVIGFQQGKPLLLQISGGQFFGFITAITQGAFSSATPS